MSLPNHPFIIAAAKTCMIRERRGVYSILLSLVFAITVLPPLVPVQNANADFGDLYVSNGLFSEILRYDGNTGAFIDAFVSSQSGGQAAGPEVSDPKYAQIPNLLI